MNQLRLYAMWVCAALSFVPDHLRGQDTGQPAEFCMACSREAWEGDSAAVSKFIASCGIIDTIGYDSLNTVVAEKPVVQKVTMRLHSGKVLYTDSIYLIPDSMPVYTGGFGALIEHFKKSIQYPVEAVQKKVSGNVIVEFIVERNGSIRQPRLVRGIGYGCNEEALRVVAAMKGWKPGKKAGKPVRVRMRLPVKFVPG